VTITQANLTSSLIKAEEDLNLKKSSQFSIQEFINAQVKNRIKLSNIPSI